MARHTETLLASCGLALNCTRKRDTAGGCTLPTGTPPDPQPSSVCTPTGDLAICDGRENESRILGTVCTESASVSVAQNGLALPEAWCSSVLPRQHRRLRLGIHPFCFFVSAHGRLIYDSSHQFSNKNTFVLGNIFRHRILRLRKKDVCSYVSHAVWYTPLTARSRIVRTILTV